MQILTPEAVKGGSSRQETEQATRVRDLATEEDRLVRSVNSLLESEREEKERIEADMVVFRAEAKAERDGLSAEVLALEARRAVAMMPIDDVSREADERNRASKEREDAVVKVESDLSALLADFKERESDFISHSRDKKQELGERESGVEEREERVEAEEELSKASLQELNGRWASFHAAVGAKEQELASRENAVSAREHAEETRTGENDRRNLELNAKEKQITDKYATLERAVRHFENKQKTP